MLISFEEINKILIENGISINGAFHIGAHECEELEFYNKLGLSPSDVVWLEAIPQKVEEAKNRGIPNVYNVVITDKDDDIVFFNVSNNVQSSSVLEFGTHSTSYPSIGFVGKIKSRTLTIDTFFERSRNAGSKYDFWNFDIQGAELMALKGATQNIQHAKAIYLEVNVMELYKGCGLMDEIDVFLSRFNFKRVLTTMTTAGWGDALYIITK